MKKILLIFICLTSFSINASDSISTSDLDIIKKLNGTYSNSRGDNASMKLEFTEKDPRQPDLFGPEEYSISLYVEDHTGNVGLELDESDFVAVNSKKGVSFSRIDDDCDNPGCTDYEVYVDFIKKRNGSHYLRVEAFFNTDAEDIAWEVSEDEAFQNASKAEQEKILDKLCEESYGPSASVSYFYKGGSVYCEYEALMYLKKN